MSFLLAKVAIPVWLLIMMNIVMILLLIKVFSLYYRYRRGDITKEEYSDMVVWKVRQPKSAAVPNNDNKAERENKDRSNKEELVQVLKILLKEGDRGVLMQTVADRMGKNSSAAQRAMKKLVENKMVDEVVGISGTKFYLTASGRDYCRRKAK